MRSRPVSVSPANQVSYSQPNLLFVLEILELDLGKDDKFIVLASDGVWEFLQNEDIAAIVKPFFDTKNAEKAAEAVVRESYLRWKREEEGIVDDITCIIIFLDVKMDQQEPSENLLQAEKELLEAAQQTKDQPDTNAERQPL